jgi:hypothetical protein
MLTLSERVALVVQCSDHPFAACPECSETVTFAGVTTDALRGDDDFCRACRTDLTAILRKHLAECTWIRVQVRQMRERAQETCANAEAVSKISAELRDRADLLMREAEVEKERGRKVKRGRNQDSEGTS